MGNSDNAIATSRLGLHIKRLRQSNALSLESLAQRAGISRATLSRIENDTVSPTADALYGIASALNVSISYLMMPLETPFQAKVHHKDQIVWSDGKGFQRRAVSPPASQLSCEVVECELQPSYEIAFGVPPQPGLEHHLVMLSGCLTLVIEDTNHSLRTGDSMRYKLFGTSTFKAGPEGARYMIVLI